MTTESLLDLLQIATAAALALGLICLLFSLFYFRRSRRDAYWRYRRDAGQRGFQFIVASVLLLALGIAFCMVTLTISFVEGGSEAEVAASPTTATLTLTPESSPTLALPTLSSDDVFPTPTFFPVATIMPSSPQNTAEPATTTDLATILNATATREIGTVPTATITLTPTVEIRASMQIEAIDSQISAVLRPVQPGLNFSQESRRLYFYIRYANMEPGTRWQKSLLKDGLVIKEQVDLWGIMPADGLTFFFFGDDRGFEPGRYEIRITVADVMLASSQFTIE